MSPWDPPRPGPSRPRSPEGLSPPGAKADPSQDLSAALHEVSNALTVLLGWADAARSMTDPREIAAALDVVTARASQARAIARRAIGAVEPPPAPVPVAALVADAALGLSVEAKRANVALRTQVDPALSGREVAAGPALLQVLTNLLLNAIAFSPPGATVRLSASVEPAAGAGAAGAGSADGAASASGAGEAAEEGASHVVLCVDDEGPGIAPEQRAHLFEAGVTSRRGGAGIGLRHSAALAVEAGGDLRLGESLVGTRFELRWPLLPVADRAAPGPESTERPVVDRPSIDGARILVIEDDAAVIELLELALEARGASVVSIQARSDLPRALSTGRFDAALLDMSPLLGDVDGAVAELRRANPEARLVVMSGSVPHAEVGGASVWVRKPFEVREIVDALSAPPPAEIES